MPYCAKSNLVERGLSAELVQLTNIGDPISQSINDAVLNNAILDACNWIDSFISAYLPLATVPANFVSLACDETIYRLYKNARTIPDAVKDSHAEAKRYLEGVRDGKIVLAADSTGTVDSAASNAVAFVSQATVFSRNHLPGF